MCSMFHWLKIYFKLIFWTFGIKTVFAPRKVWLKIYTDVSLINKAAILLGRKESEARKLKRGKLATVAIDVRIDALRGKENLIYYIASAYCI